MSRQKEIENTLIFLAEEANAGNVEALFSVDVRRHNDGEPFTTVHCMTEAGSREQREKVYDHLRGIADVLREIYAESEEVER